MAEAAFTYLCANTKEERSKKHANKLELAASVTTRTASLAITVFGTILLAIYGPSQFVED